MYAKSQWFFRGVLLSCLLAAAANAQAPVIAKKVTVSGTVSRDNGMLGLFTPIPNAMVYLEEMVYFIVTPANPATNAIVPGTSYIPVDSAKTNEGGAYSIDSVPVGAGYRLTFSAKGYQEHQVPAAIQKDTVINAKLSPISLYFSLSGTVTEGCPPGLYCIWESPIPGCTVSVRLAMIVFALPKTMEQSILPPVYTSVTDVNGNYKIDSIALHSGALFSDTVSVRAYKKGYLSSGVVTVLYKNKTNQIDFSLRPFRTSAGDPAKSGNGYSLDISCAHNTLELSLDRDQSVSLALFGLDGRLITSVFSNCFMRAGSHTVRLALGPAGGRTLLARLSAARADKVIKINIH